MTQRPESRVEKQYIVSAAAAGFVGAYADLLYQHEDLLQSQPLISAAILVGGTLIGGVVGLAWNRLTNKFLR